MATRPRNLSQRIPDDVRMRASRAGVDKLDWYAGRLEADRSAAGADESAPSERRRVRELAVNHRKQQRTARQAKYRSLVTKIVSVLRRPVGRRRHV